MPGSVADELLHGVDSTTRWFRTQFPDDEIVFAAAASHGLFQGRRRVGWGRQGVLILTQRQILFKSVWRSLYTLLFLALGIISFIAYASTEEVLFLILAILAIAATFFRLPLQRQILLADIQNAEAGSVQGFTLRGIRDTPTLSIHTGDYTLRFTLKRALTDEAKYTLGVRDAA